MVLSFYVTKLDAAYQKSRKAYTAAAEEIAACNAELKALEQKRYEYTPDGYKKRCDALRAKKEASASQIASISSDFKKAAAEIRAEAHTRYKDKYGISPNAVDEKALALINSGALSENELYAMAQEFSSNNTMVRLIGATMSKMDSESAQAIGATLIDKSKDLPHEKILTNLSYIANMALRPAGFDDKGEYNDVDTAILLSEGIANNIYSDTYESAMNQGDSITTDTVA